MTVNKPVHFNLIKYYLLVGLLVDWAVGKSVMPLVGALVRKTVVQIVGWFVDQLFDQSYRFSLSLSVRQASTYTYN